MKSPMTGRRALAAALIALTTTTFAMPAAIAQEYANDDDKPVSEPSGRAAAAAARRARRNAPAQEAAQKAAANQAATPSRYPQSTRTAPTGRASVKGTQKLQAMLKLYNDAKGAEARAAADAVIADTGANAYEKGFAARLAAQIAVEAEDYTTAMRYIDQALATNALDNNDHFDLMLMRAQLQMRAKDYAGTLRSIDQFLAESGSNRPEALVVRGNALYRLGRYADAVAPLRAATAATPGRADWEQLLADSLARSGNAGEAARLAEAVASKNPGDKNAQFNLVQSYVRTNQVAKAMQLLEQMRKAGQLTTDADYRQLFSMYANMEGKEKETLAVIDEGIAKGALKPDFQVYLAQAQSYYFTEQTDKAIAAYRMAAPLAKDGEVWLNLAGVYRNAQRFADARDAAQKAIAKGLKNPENAKKIIALPNK